MTRPHTHGHIDFIEFPAPSVPALQQTKAFLASAFGWTFKDWGDDYADAVGAGVGAGISADAQSRPAQPLVVVYSDDLERSREQILAAGGQIVLDIFSFPGGRRFHFREPSGNVLAVWSDK